MVLIFTLNLCSDYPNESSKYRSVEQENNTDIDER